VSTLRNASLCIAFALGLGCSNETPTTVVDSGAETDLGNETDTPKPADAGPGDTGPSDTGTPDAGPADVGPTPVDVPAEDVPAPSDTPTPTDAPEPGDTPAPSDAPADGSTCTGTDRALCRGGTGEMSCVDLSRDAAHCGRCEAACAPGQVCNGGVCNCPQGTVLCDGRCVATAVDPLHCGACNTRCGTGQECVGGACACPNNGAFCGGACVRPQSDNAHCGACDNACVGGSACEMGACVCPMGQRLCGAGPMAACVDTQTSDAHCGACGTACTGGQTCTAGACACPMGQTLCGGQCVRTDSDRANCGACGTVCPSPQLCSAGRCTLACDTGLTSCAAEGGAMVCANTRSDTNHCGACGQRCGSGQRCVNSACVCETGETACGTGSAAFCIDAQTDVRNCGACGNRCATQTNASGATCAGAMCRAVCSQGFGDCDSAFSNGCEIDLGRNANHCGGCGMACPMEAGVQRVCVAGRCAATSCRAIHEASPMAPSGLYRIDPDGPGGNASVVVYCDMVTQGGGWTLVGRSRPGGNLLPFCAGTDGGTSFGWRSATGAVTDDSQAYALNAAAVGLRFGEVLFGNYAMGKTWGDRLYRHRVPADFLEAYRTRQLRLGVPEELSAMRCVTQLPYGEQNPAGDTGSMFNYMGFTDNADAFHLRDVEGNGFGLSASGWMSCYRNDNCYAGAINRQQGMIMVR
jgi:hypothetical protein